MPSLTYRTLANFRSSSTATIGAIYYLCDAGLEGMFRCVGKTTREDDGALFVVAKNKVGYERILQDDVILATWYGLVPDRPDLATQNALLLDKAIKANNYCTLKLPKVPGTNSTYHFNHVAGSGIFEPGKEEACITFCDRVMVWEFELGVRAETENGYTAQQAYERYDRGYVVSKRVSYSHKGGPGKSEGLLRVNEDGALVYSQDWGNDYKTHGFKQWCAGELHGVNAYGFPGHGLSVFAQIGVKAPEVFTDFEGEVNYWNGDLFVRPRKAADLAVMSANGTRVELEGQPQRGVAWPRLEDKSVSLSYGSPESTGLKQGAVVKGRYARKTKDFFADFVQAYPLDGLNNFDGNGGNGVHAVGAEANHGQFYSVSCRDNGAWAVSDNSFLGNHWLGLHATTNGRRHNRTIGGFNTGLNPNTGASCLYGYREEGMGPDFLYGNATVAFGFSLNGVTGGGMAILNNRLQGFRQLDDLERAARPALKAAFSQARTAAVVDDLAATPTLADARAAYVAQNLMRLPMAA